MIKATLRAALTDPELLGNELQGDSFGGWRALLLAAMGEPLIGDELLAFRHLTGRAEPPSERVDELLVIAGRRAGKSLCAALLASYIASLVEHPALRPGEDGLVLVVSPDLRQSRVVLGYAIAILEGSPILRGLINGKTADSISLINGTVIVCRAASFRRLRGVTCIAAICDEACFWYSETSTNPDAEIMTALRPTLATTGGLLCTISSPYSRSGATWETFNQHFGADGDPRILVAQAASRDLNPSLPQSVVDRAYEKDAAAAAAEYGGRWRSDIAAFVDRRVVEACIDQGVHERAPGSGLRYVAFIDPSGGASDSFTLAIAHKDKSDLIIIDAIREARPPFSPEAVVSEFAGLLKQYRVTSIVGDRYGGQFPVELFNKHRIAFKPSDRTKSQLFLELLPKLNSRSVALLDHDRLTKQLCSLERRTGFTGQDRIGHPQHPSAHDDIANAVAGASWMASVELRVGKVRIGLVGPGNRVTWRDVGAPRHRERIRVVREQRQ